MSLQQHHFVKRLSNDTLYITTGGKNIIKIETNNGVKGAVTENFEVPN